MTTDDARVIDACLAAIKTLTDVFGLQDEDDGMVLEPSVDFDKLPAGVIAGGRFAIGYLATAAGLLDPDSPAHEDDFTAEEMLAIWTAKS